MTGHDFILKVIRLYEAARRPIFSDPKVKRGRSRAISSFVEELFAVFLAEKIKCDAIYVDQPISVSGQKTQNYPDIAVTKNGSIIGFCDMKTDLGFNREGLPDLCRRHYKWLKNIRGKRCFLKDGVTKKEYNYKINKHATYNVIILTEHNMNPLKLRAQIEKVRIYSPAVEVFLLSGGKMLSSGKRVGGHLNTYGISARKLMCKTEVHEKVFGQIVEKFVL